MMLTIFLLGVVLGEAMAVGRPLASGAHLGFASDPRGDEPCDQPRHPLALARGCAALASYPGA